jgi:uncharacterized membrane protein
MGQSQRLVFLDLMRVIAMIMMILGHSFFDLVSPKFYNLADFPWNFWDFVRGVTAPIFLVVSGIVQVFANKRVDGRIPKEKIYRRLRTAVLLIFLAYFLNFPVQKAFHIFFQSRDILLPFFQVNILQIIGLTLLWALLYFVLTKDNKQLGRISFWTGVIIFLLTPIVHLIDWYRLLPLPFAPYLSLAKGSYFTIFPFSGFIFFGIAYGTFLEKFPLEKRAYVVYRSGLKLGAFLLPLGILLYFVINLFNFPFYDVLKANTGMSIIRLSLVFIILSLVVILYKKYLENSRAVNEISTTLGKNALFVYVVHLVILYGLPWYPGFASIFYRKFGIFEGLLFSLLIVIVSFSLVFLFESFFKQRRFLKLVVKYGVVSLMVLMLLV